MPRMLESCQMREFVGGGPSICAGVHQEAVNSDPEKRTRWTGINVAIDREGGRDIACGYYKDGDCIFMNNRTGESKPCSQAKDSR